VATRVVDAAVTRVGVDGVDGAGKSIFADALADVLRSAGWDVVRVSLDGFHRPRELRYRRGRSSPDGFWLDSYDYARFRANVLAPFSPGGYRVFRRAIRDVASDQPVHAELESATSEAILIVDGIFLHRDELVDNWEFTVFLDVGFDETFARMARRDGCPPDPAAPQNRRYLEGQRIYLAACDPLSRADVVIDNTDPLAPRLVESGQKSSAGTDS
jgi:uridine kinase